MATPTPIVELDFDAIKNQLKTYLRSQSQFKDYNFEGSNMSVLLDVLAYNTYHNNFYTNMAINEMFLDSAQIKNSVVSHAKELNYLPRSRKSAKAVVRLVIDDVDNIIDTQTITVPTYTEFTTTYLGQTYNFVTNQTYVARKVGLTTYETDNIEIFEGEMLASFEREGFIIDADGVLRVALSNPEVDTDSIVVFIDAEQTEDQNVFQYRTNIFGVGPTDKVFYVEPYFDNRYNVYFGGNVFGLQPEAQEDVKVRYRITSGPEANGASAFTTSFVEGVDISVITVQNAEGGAERETIDSIKFNAPKSLQIQERAITTTDYEILLKQQFPEISAVSAYGGDQLEPPQFGKVAISVFLRDDNQLISQTLANSYIDYLKDRTPLTIEPFFVQTEFIYADLKIDVFYTSSDTDKSGDQIEALVRQVVANYSDTYLESFNSSLRLSKLSKDIDAIDTAILSNSIMAKPIIEFSPDVNIKSNPRFVFGTALKTPYAYMDENGFRNYKPSIRSSVFDQDAVCVYFQDDGKGNIQIVTDDLTNPQVTNPSAGTVNYNTGEIKLSDFITESYPNGAIKILADTQLNDINAPAGRVFILRDADVRVNVYEGNQLKTTVSTSTVNTDPITVTNPTSGSGSY